jgi:hypothetical protein
MAVEIPADEHLLQERVRSSDPPSNAKAAKAAKRSCEGWTSAFNRDVL